MYFWLTIASILLFIIFYFKRKDLREEMVWAGILSIPVFLIRPLVSPQFFPEIARTDLYLVHLAEALVFGFSFGGFAAVAFEVLFHERLKTTPYPHRLHLNWLGFGIISFFIARFAFSLSFALSLSIGFLTQILILLSLRKDLFWDMLVSGLFVGGIYLAFYYIFFTVFPGSTQGLWFTSESGIMFFNIPVEEAIVIFAFGMLFGPLYEGMKGMKLRRIR